RRRAASRDEPRHREVPRAVGRCRGVRVEGRHGGSLATAGPGRHAPCMALAECAARASEASSHGRSGRATLAGMTSILVVGDTHVRTWDELPAPLRALIAEADIAIHCGDWTGVDAVEGFRAAARRAV